MPRVPDDIRHIVRAPHHPARAVECPHCGAHPHRPCTTKSGRRRLTGAEVHAGRVAAWARLVACCPACQVEPGVECHNDGRPLYDGMVHHQRYTEADRSVA